MNEHLFDNEGNIVGAEPWNYEIAEYTYQQFDKISYETPKAWLIEIGWKQAWFPKNYCWFENHTITVPTWFTPNFTDLT